ncbi:MAG: hypothetical protein GWM92_18235, partial [Gemmatimonadetes bacterium]|nr:ankyrin repeat domain-containing protein [Gemmatimonadota bacterium]NIR80742.1 ankyrin repeat domain-containing protein [Gemmatimonadota bacterium]NIT89546.1 ankyrin repeat domain-containing protein [Gemmatimonadota bacterium]NIU33341.1 ankyrin repeat domain-containing protein [Gemmatimonadota bacterium]NIU37625.1 hypothetical protein [Gemmatimonadota bacterium]
MRGKALLGAGFFGAAAVILLLSVGLAGGAQDPGTEGAAYAGAVEGSRRAASAAARLPASDNGRPVLDTGPPVADAAMKGNLAAVRALVEQGADVNAAQGDGMTALHWAALNGDAELARILVYAGATLKAVTRAGGHTPLHLAARAGHPGVIDVLLDAGADPEPRSATGVTPLHLAAASGSAAAVEALL